MKLFQPTAGYIGVDIGTGAIKVAQLVRRGGQHVLSHAMIVERSEPGLAAAETSEFGDRDLVAVLNARDQLTGRRAASTLSMQGCEYRCQPLTAEVRSSQLETNARQLAVEQTGFKGEIQSDYWISNTRHARGTTSTLHVLATPTAATRRIVRSHRAAGLTCQILDGLPAALARALSLSGDATDDRAIAAIDWGYSQVTFCIIQGGVPAFVRSFRGGNFGALVGALCESINLTSAESRQVLVSPGLPTTGANSASKLQTCISEATAAALDEFREELAKTLSYLEVRHRELLPEKLVLFGGGATIGNAAELVSAWTGRNTQTWSFPAAGEVPLSDRLPAALLGPAIALSALSWGQP